MRARVFVSLFAAGAVTAAAVGGKLAANDRQITNSIGMALVKIEPGSFAMGESNPIPDALKLKDLDYLPNGDWDEKPVRRVTISKPFYIGVTEVTLEQYKQFKQDYVPPTPGKLENGQDAPATPYVTGINWHEAAAFCEWLSKKGRQDLPSPHRSRMGIRGARRHDDSVLVGRGAASGGCGQSVGPEEHARRRRRVGARLACGLSGRGRDRSCRPGQRLRQGDSRRRAGSARAVPRALRQSRVLRPGLSAARAARGDREAEGHVRHRRRARRKLRLDRRCAPEALCRVHARHARIIKASTPSASASCSPMCRRRSRARWSRHSFNKL